MIFPNLIQICPHLARYPQPQFGTHAPNCGKTHGTGTPNIKNVNPVTSTNTKLGHMGQAFQGLPSQGARVRTHDTPMAKVADHLSQLSQLVENGGSK